MLEGQTPVEPTQILEHALYDNCANPNCSSHHPVGAPGINQRDLAMFLAGAQTLIENFQQASNRSLGLPDSATYAQRLIAVEQGLRSEVELWLFGPGKRRKKRNPVRTRKRRVRQTFH